MPAIGRTDAERLTKPAGIAGNGAANWLPVARARENTFATASRLVQNYENRRQRLVLNGIDDADQRVRNEQDDLAVGGPLW